MSDVLRRWRKWHREQLNQALAGPHGAVVKQIVDMLDDLAPRQMPALLAVLRAQDWRGVDVSTRFVILHEINTAIAELREREGKPSFGDSLPGEAPTLFETIREMLR
jgi:hypothetical protein